VAPSKVTRVHGEVLYKRTLGGKAAGLPPAIRCYHYSAVLEDGTEEVLLNRATHHYVWAYQWVKPVAAGKRGLAAYFTYSNFPVTSPSALARFHIEWL
jgi:hypothetical protein